MSIETDPIKRQEYADGHPFIILFQNAERQQMLFDEKVLPFREILNITLVYPTLRRRFIEHTPWRVRILQDLIIRKTFLTIQAPAFTFRDDYYETVVLEILSHRGAEVVPNLLQIVETRIGSSIFHGCQDKRTCLIAIGECLAKERTPQAIKEGLRIVNDAKELSRSSFFYDNYNSAIAQIYYEQAHLGDVSCLDAGDQIIKMYQQRINSENSGDLIVGLKNIIDLSSEKYEEKVTDKLIRLCAEMEKSKWKECTPNWKENILKNEIQRIKEKIQKDRIFKQIEDEIESDNEDYLQMGQAKVEALHDSENYCSYLHELAVKYLGQRNDQAVAFVLQMTEKIDDQKLKLDLLYRICKYKLQFGGLKEIDAIKELINQHPNINSEEYRITHYNKGTSKLSIMICDALLDYASYPDGAIIERTKELLSLVDDEDCRTIPNMILYLFGESEDVIASKKYFESAEVHKRAKNDMFSFISDQFVAIGVEQACRAIEFLYLTNLHFHVEDIIERMEYLGNHPLTNLRQLIKKVSKYCNQDDIDKGKWIAHRSFALLASARAESTDPMAIRDALNIVEWIPRENLLSTSSERRLKSWVESLIKIAFCCTDKHIPKVGDLSTYFQACCEMVKIDPPEQSLLSKVKHSLRRGENRDLRIN